MVKLSMNLDGNNNIVAKKHRKSSAEQLRTDSTFFSLGVPSTKVFNFIFSFPHTEDKWLQR